MILEGNCTEKLKDINDNSIDLIVTDPPYGIEFMGKDWDRAVVPVDIWKQCYRILKQGKIAFIMCSPRQDVLSRMIVNLQDAGFRTNYTSIYWTFASGFPKAANVSKLIDKKAGAEREILGKRTDDRYGRKYTDNSFKDGIYESGQDIDKIGLITKPATEAAKQMEGAYVGFQPKPAVEIILVVSKGKTLTWLDDCRIPYQSEDDLAETNKEFKLETPSKTGIYQWNKEQGQTGERTLANEKGRFPANLLCGTNIEYDLDSLLELQEELKHA